MRRTPLLGLLLGLALLASACAGSHQPSASQLRDRVSTQLRTQISLTKAQADCYAKLIVDKVGIKTANKISIADKDPAPAVAKDLAAAAIAARTTCGLGGSTTATTSTTASTTTTSTGK